MFNFFHKKDHQIQEDVKTEIRWDPRIASENINVSIKDGDITLSGTVPYFYEKYNAEDAARRVGGVKAVYDELKVDAPESYGRSDGEILHAAQQALIWNNQVPVGLKVDVSNGFVTLTGQVDWAFQKHAAYDAVNTLWGVIEINNEITIRTKDVDSNSVKTQIQAALKRSASTEGKNIEVNVEGGKVTLSGYLDSYSDIETVRIAAWNAPGVKEVVNNLYVTV